MSCELGVQMMTAKPTPAQGYSVHVMAPYKYEDETVHGPYHHYSKRGMRKQERSCYATTKRMV
jgi:hypothetical protein